MNSKIRARLVEGAAACAVALAFSGAAFAQDSNSGFLRNYSDLSQGTDTQGKTIRAWANPKFTPANYSAVLLDPLIFYPEPKPSPKVSAAELQKMLAYANSALKQSLGSKVNLADRAGPGVVRIRAAITSVGAKAGELKPYQMIPLAFVATMAAGGPGERALLVVETEATDSVSGELLAERVRVGTGAQLAKIGNMDVITLDSVKPLLDELAQNAFAEAAKYVKGK